MTQSAYRSSSLLLFLFFTALFHATWSSVPSKKYFILPLFFDTTDRSETPEHVWMTHQRRNEPSSRMKQRTHGGRNQTDARSQIHSDFLANRTLREVARTHRVDPHTHKKDHRNLRPHMPGQLQRTITTIPERTVPLSVKAPLNTSQPAERPFDPRLEVINETRAAHHAATTSDSGANHTSSFFNSSMWIACSNGMTRVKELYTQQKGVRNDKEKLTHPYRARDSEDHHGQ